MSQPGKTGAQLYHLSNGIQVIIDPVPHVQTVSMGFSFNVGARHETLANNGVAHFFEHMAFKGTKARTARQIIEEVEGMGADINAMTGKDSTTYLIKGLAKHAPQFIDVLSDIVLNSTLPEDEFERERGVIIEEIAGYQDDFDDVAFNALSRTSYPGQPVGATILGPKENIENMTRRQMFDFMKDHYHAGNLTVSITGNVDPKAMLAELENKLGKMLNRPKSAFQKAVYAGGAVHEERPIEQLRLVFAFPAYPASDPRYWTSKVLGGILGGGMSSRLFNEIRVKRGLVYSISSQVSALQDMGSFMIYAGTTRHDMIQEFATVLAGELNKLRTQDVSPGELARMKAQMQVGLAEAEENMMGRMLTAPRNLQREGKLVTAQDIIDAVDKITPKMLRDVANDIFSQKPTVATVGKGQGLDPVWNIEQKLKLKP